MQSFEIHEGFIFRLKNFAYPKYEQIITSGEDGNVKVFNMTKDSNGYNLENTKTFAHRKVCQDI
eukprot:CAMPEP_0116913382 /NCGR_PEP_ID=MMETSP0467-20121206/16673_1 /TAXON_ID=283647 /ORGANISM="Mesodinium pulex, Strain SPMC105" /LENGTH=63 /DNA_ID=CAMNT_0004589591 /DNA_START=587 /DNA_END=778 /DNA_ORIENTATION=+